MSSRTGGARALLWGVSVVALTFGYVVAVQAQSASPQIESGQQAQQDKQKKRKKNAKRQNQQAPKDAALNANAQATPPARGGAQTLDTITVAATKTEERAIDALAPVSVITQDQIQTQQPRRLGEILRTVPGVSLQERGDDPSTSVNIRGLQDFGRVAVVVDGARQNYQRTGHNANGAFFLDPELIGGIDIVRGPTSNIYGSGAIGGLVSLRTKDIDDVVRPGERWGVDLSGNMKSNKIGGIGSIFGGVRAHPSVDVFGGAVYRSQSNYKDGAGTEIGNTGNDTAAGLLKITTRPADGHTVKLGGIFQNFQYDVGQFNRGATTAAAPAAAIAGTSVYASDVSNYTGTLNWKYSKPDDQIFDWNVNLYGNRTDQNQVKTYNQRLTNGGICPPGTFGNNITGCTGDRRGYLLDTIGIDVNNTSRFGLLGWNNALTYGFDAFRDDVSTFDTRGNSNVTTPSGVRTVSGAFVQLKSNYSTWLEVISAVRYDRYELDSAGVSSSGDRLSPKITVGVTPVAGFTPYVSYAEGYRAPSITETVINGAHATGGAPFSVNCPGGITGLFCFLPNPLLRPEVGKTKEIGVNLKYDNIVWSGDTFRGKLNYFRNDLVDFIDQVPFGPIRVQLQVPGPPTFTTVNQFIQYQNTGAAFIQGFEGELFYDAGNWFAGVAGNVLEGETRLTGIGISSLIQPHKIVTTLGGRFFDRKLTVSAQWISFAANNRVNQTTFLPATSGDIVNLYLAYAPTPDVTINFGIDNIFDRYYRPYAIPRSDTTGSTQNDVLFSSPGPGITYKGGIKIHFGGA